MEERQLTEGMKECVSPEVEPSPESRHTLALVSSAIARGFSQLGSRRLGFNIVDKSLHAWLLSSILLRGYLFEVKLIIIS